MSFDIKPGQILLAEKSRGFHVSTFVPFAIRLITGNEIAHVGIVESCNESTVTYWDANSGPGVKRYMIPNVWSSQEGGLVLANGMVVTSVATSPIVVSKFDVVAPYNYWSIANLAKDHLFRQFVDSPKTGPDKHYPKRLNCSQYVGWLLLSRGGGRMGELFPDVSHPALLEPDNFTTAPFIKETLIF